MLHKLTSTEKEITKTKKIISSIKDKISRIKKRKIEKITDSVDDDFHLFI